MKIIIAFSAMLLFSTAIQATEIALINPGFETAMNKQEIPGWNQIQHAGVEAYEMSIDDKIFHTGKHSFRMHRFAEQVFGLLEQNVAVAEVAGKNIELAGVVRTSDIGKEGLRLSMNFLSSSGTTIAQVDSSLFTGTSKKWLPVKLLGKAPIGTASISIDVLLLDKGTLWVDDFHLRIVEH